LAGIFSRKPVNQILAEADEKGGMKRSLTAVHLVALGVGGIIGGGIFVLTGAAAADHAGPAILISFILAGIASAFAGLCYSEFAAMLPISGSAYTYAYATLGELMAWIIGWDLVLEYLFGASTVAVSWSGYFASFLKEFHYHKQHLEIPPSLCGPLFTNVLKDAALTPDGHPLHAFMGLYTTGNWCNIPAILITLALTALLVRGMQESATFNALSVAIKTTVILAFIIVGALYINPENWHPFIPANQGWGKFGISGIIQGAGVIFFAYIGFDAVSTAAQETKNPQRDLPIGILGSLVICTVLYVLVAIVLTGVVHYTQLGVPDPIAVAVDKAGAGLAWLRFGVKFGAVCGLTSVILVMLMSQPRIFYTMAKDGLLPEIFGRLHPVYRTPYVPQILTGVIAAFFAGILPVGMLGEMVSIGTLLAFVLVCGGVIVLRRTDPDRPRPFRTPWVPVVPILGMCSCFFLMAGLPIPTWIRLIVWMAIGLVIYFAYGAQHSKVRRSE
jgi:APA family basic amino acid/polyamine antiporter